MFLQYNMLMLGTGKGAVTAVIPARNENNKITLVLEEVIKYADEVIVVDDASTDDTIKVAQGLGVKVISSTEKRGISEQ